jgi:hypothetical protein
MQTWMVWTFVRITPASFREFGESFGKGWNEMAADEGSIEQGEARVYFGFADAGDEKNVVPEDVEHVSARMGGTPVSMLSIRIGHGSGSLPLAERVASRAVEAWDGFWDRNVPC